jgi:plastocyanin
VPRTLSAFRASTMHIRNLLLGTMLLVSACGADDAAPPNANAGTNANDKQHDESCTATINLLDYKLEPKDIEADSGKITLCAVNKGATSHDLGVRDADKKTLAKTMTLSPGDEDRFTVELSAAKYDIYCSVNGHESLGMKGTLTAK